MSNTFKEDKELVDIINQKYLDNNDDWTKIIWACRAEDNIELARYISTRSTIHNEKDMKVAYDSFVRKNNAVNKDTFYHYAKISNEDKYLEIRAKYHSFDEIGGFTDNDAAKTFCKLFGCDYIYYDKHYYCFDGILWLRNDSGNKLKLAIANDLSTFYLKEATRRQDKLNKITDKTTQEIHKKQIAGLLDIVKKLQNFNTLNNVFGMIKNYIERGKDDIAFETKPYLFAFKNKIFNLRTCNWVEPSRDDYLYVSTGYDWVEPTDETITDLHKLLDTIFPRADEKKLYLTLLATGLCGRTLENFIMANGSGGNGKGVLNELCEKLFGNYAYNCANAVLLAPIKTGNNPTVANMKHKRIVFYREPDTSVSQGLNLAAIKELTGGEEINARVNYSNDTKTLLSATHILECNERPKLCGRVDDATIRRLIDIPFRSVFTAKPDEYFGEYVYAKNIFYKSSEFKNEYKYALFTILVEYWKEYLESGENIDAFVCDSVVERTKTYLEANDELKAWIDERYERSGNRNDIIQISDIYTAYKDSEDWFNLSKKERRETTKKKYIEKIANSIHFRKYYKEREQSKAMREKYRVKEMRNVLVGFVLKGEVEEEED